MTATSSPKFKRKIVIVGWMTIFTQAALPLSLVYTPLVQAADRDDTRKWYQSTGQQQNSSLFDDATSPGAPQAQSNSTDAAAGMARSAATGALNNSVEAWLSQFGTARVQLNLDDKFKSNGSEADLLVPLYDGESTILFTQFGFRHQDDRNTGNLGLGARYLAGDWMLGANTFFDNDFTGENRRIGIGGEAWRDYLKLSVNGYFRLSDWHQSRDFSNYDERPANGYDVRAEGWLPAWPQLGAKLMYEQYQGDEVALFGKDNRQQDPWALTAGVTYTPVPLFTVGAQHRAGKDGQNDTQVMLQMNYRLGEAWDTQLDPSRVGDSRTLAGTRYDLVERNNSIVLEYRKQQSIFLTLPDNISGKGRSVIPVTFSVKSENPLQRIDWDAASLVAAGGSIAQSGSNQLSITLPPYQAGGSNVYHFAGVAYDTKGNSASATASLTVNVGEVSTGSTRISATPTTLPADGKSISVVSIELFDADGNPVPGMAGAVRATLKETRSATARSTLPPADATIGAVEETAPGTYQMKITAGTRTGTVVVSPTYNDTALEDITITQAADAATGQIAAGAILTSVDNSAANGTAVNTVKATITDAANNRLPDTEVTFTLSGSATVAAGSSLKAVTDDKGQVSVSFVNKVAEAVTVTAALANGNSGSVETHFTADSTTAAVGSESDISVDKTTLVANGLDAATFSAVVKDGNGNPVPGFTVNWGSDKGVLSAASSQTDAKGIATITLTHNVAEAVQVTAQAGGAGPVNAPSVNFSADAATATLDSGDLSVDNTTVVANNTDVATFTALVKDAGGNPVPGVDVGWTTDKGTLSGSTSTTGTDGKATIMLKATEAGDAQVAASVNGSAPLNADKVTFTADSTTAAIDSDDLTVDKTTIVANNTDSATYTALVKDVNGNPVANVSVEWSSDYAGLPASSTITGSDGKATVVLKGTKAQMVNVTAKVNSASQTAPQVTLTADASTAKIDASSISIDKASIVADNVESATYTVKVTDAHDNPLANAAVSWATDVGNVVADAAQTDGNGVVTAKLTADKRVAPSEPDTKAVVSVNVSGSAAVKASALDLVIPAQTYIGPTITFDRLAPPKSSSVNITGRTGKIDGKIQVRIKSAYTNMDGVYIRITAPNGKEFELKKEGVHVPDIDDKIYIIDATGINKSGTWKIDQDDAASSGSHSGTMSWEVVL